MRLHQLDITAFGPFPDTVHVDFDELSGAGLFLLTGPTGAGKSSVLDAVCFAIYGDVPGERSSAKRLRADQAAAGVAPRVVLEVTLAGRRFRIARSPAWQREKKRGGGTTLQQASVVVTERTGSDWITLATRLDEAGQLLGALLGMSLTQFTQVAMLPQGRFSTFLRAKSEERHRVLQQLFRTGRFEDAERWLRERRLVLARSDQQANDTLATLLSRFSEAGEVTLPDTWDLHDLAEHCDDGSVRWWCEGRHASARAELTRARAAREVAAAREADSRTPVEQARQLATRRARLAAAQVEADQLALAAPGVRVDLERVAASRRAALVTPARARAATLRSQEAATVSRANEALGRVSGPAQAGEAGWDGAGWVSELTGLAEDRARAAAHAAALAPRGRRLHELDERLEQLAADAVGTRRTSQEAGARAVTLPAEVAAARLALDAARTAAGRIGATRLLAADLEARVCAHGAAEGVERELVDARSALRAAQDDVAQCRETWLDIRERRLDAMAAEIALDLAVGGCCPVCGSCDHPAKAAPAPGAPDAAAEREAHHRVDDANLREQLRHEEVRDLATRLAVARERAGADPLDVLQDQVIAVREELDGLQRLAGAVADRESGLADLETLAAGLQEQLRELAARSAAAESTRTALGTEREELARELDEVLRPGGDADLDTLVARLRGEEAAARAAVAALEQRDRARADLASAHAELEEALTEAGFVDESSAQRAELPVAEQQRLERAGLEHERRAAVVAATLDEEGAGELLAGPGPDLAALEADLAAAVVALGAATTEAGRRELRCERLADLLAELDTHLAAWAPVRAQHALTARLASFVEGKSPDNAWQMRLSAYVLAYRLGQVVAAANERLSRMSDQRYSLEHTSARGAGETRGGLSLLVRDDWSGAHRDPATLSGGETFVVSLALALGLADVIAQEAGGAEIDTLFVDEGFGSLDADTLDDVMDTLDALRDGGRVIGVVSHVAEMRDRIPTQLRVAKSRAGSTLSTSTGAG